MGERRFLVDSADLTGERAFIRGGELHHLLRVLRLKPGDAVSVFDGAGRGYKGQVETLTRDEALVSHLTPEDPSAEPAVSLTLLQSMPHGDRMDFIVEKATELGVGRVIPVVSERSVLKTAGSGWGRLERFRRIAVSSAKQSGRLIVPVIDDPVRFESAVAWTPAGGNVGPAGRVVFHPGAGPLEAILQSGRALSAVAVLIGPEGGFAPSEIEMAVGAGWGAAGIGSRILRADTAALAALTLVQKALGALD